ncbi:MAG TPA: thiamine pyrophosphate-dependent dehydrogenase E1 component subunit alpha [Ktedonobacteraceae bacterium]
MTELALSHAFIRDLYARMLLTRIVDEYAWKLHLQGHIGVVARACGHEAAQVGSAICIEKGVDFTLPYYRDLGVVLTIGMTPYEVFRTYLQATTTSPSTTDHRSPDAMPAFPQQHWGYHKHNTVTGPAPVATQILHAAGIAFASKLRKTRAVTVAYCGDGATTEADFLEGIRFSTQHQLPVIFICEQDCTPTCPGDALSMQLKNLHLPQTIIHHRIDGTDIIAVYTAMCEAMQYARDGQGPTLLELCITRPQSSQPHGEEQSLWTDPLLRCQHILQQQGAWDETWADQLRTRLTSEVEQALYDTLNPS